MLSAPLMGKRGPLGLIRAFSTEVDHFTDADASFLAAMASEGSIAIENAMAYRALGQLDEMKSKFVLTVTHELRSPVGVDPQPAPNVDGRIHGSPCRTARQTSSTACFAGRTSCRL